MRRLLRLCLLGSVLALGAGAAAADVPVPLYLGGGDRPGGEFAVLSNGAWKVKAGTRLVRPDVVSVSNKGRPEGTSPRERQDLAVVWAPTCSPLSQVATFVRNVVLPGPPSEIGFEWDWTAPYGAFTQASLYVNGVHVYTSKDRTRIEHDKTSSRTGLFRDGVNHIEVRVKKRAIPPGVSKACNTGVPSRDYGVRFLVQGKFAADVAVRTDIPATEIKRVGYLTPVTGAIDIINNGPSRLYWGRFRLIIGGTFKSLLFADGPTATGAGVSGCTSSAAPRTFASTITIECDLRDMRAHTKAVVNFGLVVELTSSGDGALRYYREVVASADDPKPQNNTHMNTILLCTENTTNPACKG